MSHQPIHATARPGDWSRLDDDSRWIAEHDEQLLAEFRGKWIAVHNQRVIGSGDTAVKAAHEADRFVPNGDYVLCACEDYPDFNDARLSMD